jgi:Mrp family chromosome partitioning ATPase
VQLLGSPAEPAVNLLSRTAEGVTVIPAGRTTNNPSNVLGTAAMERLLTQLARRFDHVLVDSPAVLNATDAVLLSKLADATVMVAGVGVSGAADLTTATDRLRGVRSAVLGAVVTRAPKSSPAPTAASVPFA